MSVRERLAHVWGRRAAQVVRPSDPPTVVLAPVRPKDAVTQHHARAVIDLAMRVAEAMLATGASAAESVATVLRLTRAYDVHHVHVDITYTSITVSIHRGFDEDPLTVVRVIAAPVLDYARLQTVHRFVGRLVDDHDAGRRPPPPDEALDHLGDLLVAPHPYRTWVKILGNGLIAGGVTMLLGGRPAMWVVAGVAAVLIGWTQRLLTRARIAAFFSQAVCATIPTLIALGLILLRRDGVMLQGIQSPSLVVVSGIVVLLAGLGLVGAMQDALDGYYITASARALEVVMLTLGIAVGVATVLGAANRLGVSMAAAPFVRADATPGLGTVGAMLVALGFALTSYTGTRATVFAMVTAGLTWTVAQLLVQLGLVWASVAVAAFVGGALAYVAGRRYGLPELAIATASIVPLLPGMPVYRFLYFMMQNNPDVVANAIMHLVEAMTIGLGLAAGLSMGGYLSRRAMGLDRAGRRALRRAPGG